MKCEEGRYIQVQWMKLFKSFPYCGQHVGYKAIVYMVRCIRGIQASPIGRAKSSKKAPKQDQWPVPGTFRKIIVFVIYKIGIWILHNGHVVFELFFLRPVEKNPIKYPNIP